MVAGHLHLAGQGQQRRDRGEEHRGGLAPRPRAHEAPHGLGEEERGGGGGGVDAHGQAGHVHSLGDHAHGHQPAVGRGGEGLDAAGGAVVVGEDHGGGLAGDGAQLLGVGASLGLVGGDDEGSGVGDLAAHLGQALVGGGQDRGDPLPRRVERGAPGLGLQVLGEGLAQARRDLVAGLGAPPHLPRVGHEHHRAHDSVAQGVGVAVGVVRLGAFRPGGVLLVPHEGDRGGVGAEGRSSQGQSPPCRGEGLPDRVSPAQGVSPVVDLVEDDQGAGLVGAGAVQVGVGCHLGVGQGDAVEARAECPLGVGVGGVDMDADAGGGLGPLVLEVLSGADDRHLVDVSGAEQLGGHPQREGRLAGPGGGHRQEVLGHRLQVLPERSGLPGAQ